MVVRKIVKINESLCTGCGNCIPKCEEGALQIVNGKAIIVKDIYCDGLGACLGHCPQGAISIVEREADRYDKKAVDAHVSKAQEKRYEKIPRHQWPVQLNLVPIEALSYEGVDLLLVADCVPIAYPALHDTLMPGKRVVIGCPKFDDVRAYAQKLGEILKLNKVASVTIVHMEVPCCSGLKLVVDKAIEASGKKIPVRCYEITVMGKLDVQS